MRIKVTINSQYAKSRFAPKFQKAQQWLDSEVLKDSDPYVPMQTGNLVRSGQRGTKVGSGVLHYTAPYARAQYYGYPRKNRDKHPQATTQWFEKAKAVHRPKWISGVNKLVRE